MTSMSHATAMYATKRRRRNSKNVRSASSKDTHTKSNPSKRHRERLNQELDTLAALLPFEQSVLSKLDKLSILRLSVSYLRTKSYFKAALNSGQLGARSAASGQHQAGRGFHAHHAAPLQQPAPAAAEQPVYPAALCQEGDLIVQALNGFLLILTCDGEVFYTSQTVETYLGFHQSDICHQSVYELVHSEDREELMQQLRWNSMISQHYLHNGADQLANGLKGAAAGAGSLAASNNTTGSLTSNKTSSAVVDANGKSPSQMSLQEILASPEHRHLLERNFTVRFRCLLDNTSGFLRLDIRGRIKVLHGQQNPNNLSNLAGSSGRKSQHAGQTPDANYSNHHHAQAEPILAFFGVCIPFGPPSLLEMPSKDSVFKSKHRLDLSIISMESRGKQLLGYTDLTNLLNKQQASSASAAATNGAVPGPPASLAMASSADADNQPAEAPETTTSPVPAPNQPTNSKLKSEGGKTTATTTTTPATSAASGAGLKSHHQISAYDLVHQDDLSYMASAHQELLKTGASGLIAYRMIAHNESKPNRYQWLQTSAKLYYKNSKPDFILCTHRPLMEEEGRDLLGKRTMDFKVTYLDVGGLSAGAASSAHERASNCDSTKLNGDSASSMGAKRPAGVGSGARLADTACGLSPAGPDQNGAKLKKKKKLQQASDTGDNFYSASHKYHEGLSTPGPLGPKSMIDEHKSGDCLYDLDALSIAKVTKLAPPTAAPETATATITTTPSSKSANNKKHRYDSSAGRTPATKRADSQASSVKASSKRNKQQCETVISQATGDLLPLSNHHHFYYDANSAASTQTAVDYTTGEQAGGVVSYPAIHAAAAYAATVAHHQHPSHQGQQQAYGGGQTGGQQHSEHQRQLADYQSAQSAAALAYGSNQQAAAAAAAAAAYSSHTHTHSQLGAIDHYHQHPAPGLEATSYHSQQLNYAAAQNSRAHHHQTSAAHYSHHGHHGSTYHLPHAAEHLLHHYSQSAARSAALVGWSSGDYAAPHQASQSAESYRSVSSETTQGAAAAAAAAASSSSWAAAAAAAALATQQQQHQHLSCELAPSSGQCDIDAMSVGSGGTDQDLSSLGSHGLQARSLQTQNACLSPSGKLSAPSPRNETTPIAASNSATAVSLQQRYGQHHQLAKANLNYRGPASLNSDGSSAHRSPLSSDSSNGSASLLTSLPLISSTADGLASSAAAVAAAAAAAAAASMINPTSSYYGLPGAERAGQSQTGAGSSLHQAGHAYLSPYSSGSSSGLQEASSTSHHQLSQQSQQQTAHYDASPSDQHYQQAGYYSHHQQQLHHHSQQQQQQQQQQQSHPLQQQNQQPQQQQDHNQHQLLQAQQQQQPSHQQHQQQQPSHHHHHNHQMSQNEAAYYQTAVAGHNHSAAVVAAKFYGANVPGYATASHHHHHNHHHHQQQQQQLNQHQTQYCRQMAFEQQPVCTCSSHANHCNVHKQQSLEDKNFSKPIQTSGAYSSTELCSLVANRSGYTMRTATGNNRVEGRRNTSWLSSVCWSSRNGLHQEDDRLVSYENIREESKQDDAESQANAIGEEPEAELRVAKTAAMTVTEEGAEEKEKAPTPCERKHKGGAEKEDEEQEEPDSEAGDPLAELISSTIGDIILDVAPSSENCAPQLEG